MQEKGPSAEFGMSLTRYQTGIYAYILSLVPDRNAAEDVLQETNLVLWEKASEYEPGTDFLAWAVTIARYKALHARRTHARDRHQFSSAVAEQLADRLADRIGDLDDRRRALRICLTKLSEADQKLLAERYRAGGSVDAIAREHERTSTAISQKLYRLRAILMDCIKRTTETES